MIKQAKTGIYATYIKKAPFGSWIGSSSAQCSSGLTNVGAWIWIACDDGGGDSTDEKGTRQSRVGSPRLPSAVLG